MRLRVLPNRKLWRVAWIGCIKGLFLVSVARGKMASAKEVSVSGEDLVGVAFIRANKKGMG
jgi:hypothetical protein